MKPLLSLLVLGGVALALAPAAQAGGNRKISDVRLVHPPGTPPGTWRVEAEVECEAVEGTALPADFSYLVRILFNGVEIEVVPETATLDAVAALCNFATCNGGSCGPWANIPPYPPYPGDCRLVTLGSGLQACACTGRRWTLGGSNGTQLMRTDQITVTVEASVGSLTDDDVSDDSLTILAGPELSFCDDWDGALASCPCGNPGDPFAGCDIAQSTGGVSLSIVAQSTSPNSATLSGTGFPPASSPVALVIRSANLEAAPVVFGDGLRCVGIPLVRLAATAASGGTSTHVLGHAAMAGPGDFHYQIWFRNTPATYCMPEAFNMSNGRTLTW